MELLYHYTTIDSLFYILSSIERIKGKEISEENKTLCNWQTEAKYHSITMHATHLCYMNDLSEGQLLPEALRTCNVPESAVFACTPPNGYPYIISFSKLDDDINMWRNYANKGRGVSLAFDRYRFDVELKDCIYTTIEELVEKISKKNLVKPNGEITDLMRFSKEYLCAYKHNAYSPEKEVRIVREEFLDEKFYLKKDKIIPYYDVKINLGALQSIKIGPMVNDIDFERLRFSILRLLKSKNLPPVTDFFIEKSNIPMME
jgi:hypothetical protein